MAAPCPRSRFARPAPTTYPPPPRVPRAPQPPTADGRPLACPPSCCPPACCSAAGDGHAGAIATAGNKAYALALEEHPHDDACAVLCCVVAHHGEDKPPARQATAPQHRYGDAIAWQYCCCRYGVGACARARQPARPGAAAAASSRHLMAVGTYRCRGALACRACRAPSSSSWPAAHAQ